METLDEFIRNLYEEDWLPVLPGIRGQRGVQGFPLGEEANIPMGIDLLDMESGTQFPLHTHPGAHILFILEGQGTVTIGDHVYTTRPGDCFFIPGGLQHGVGAPQHHQFLSIGFPHKSLEDPSRMDIVDPGYLENQPSIAQIYSGDDLTYRRKLLRVFQENNIVQGEAERNG